MKLEDRRALRRLLDTRPIAALGTLHGGEPAVSMVPFVRPDGDTRLFIHVSALAPHTRDMRDHARVSLLVTAELDGGTSAQALPRVALAADARFVARQEEIFFSASRTYLQRFPDAAVTFELGDFSLVALQPVSARLVAGFGRAQVLAGAALDEWLRS